MGGYSVTYKVKVPKNLFGATAKQVDAGARNGVKALLELGQVYTQRSYSLVPPSVPGTPPAIDMGLLYRQTIVGMSTGRRAWGYLRAATRYAIFLEFGTSKMAARPFLRRAMMHMVKQGPDVIGHAIFLSLRR